MKTLYDNTVIENINNDKRKKLLKFFTFPMRTGKTYGTIWTITPHLLYNTDCDWVILTAPLNGIINQNSFELTLMCSENKFVYTNNLSEIKKSLKLGKKVVSYWTNSRAFSHPTYKEFFKTINLSKVGIIVDEADWGSVSGVDNLPSVKAYKQPDYRASMYTTVGIIAQKSPYTYALTATPNYEIRKVVDTVDDLEYELITPMIEGEQKVYAPRVAWAGNATFYKASNNPLCGETNGTMKTMSEMFFTGTAIEKNTSLKRSYMIQIQDRDEELNDEAVINRIASDKNLLEPLLTVADLDEWIGCVLTSEKIILWNLLGNTKKLTEKDLEDFGFDPNLDAEEQILDAIDSQKNPLRILLVKQMAGRGVTMKTCKELMILRTSCPVSELGYITEGTEQMIGRAKSPYMGSVEIPVLYNKYDGDCQKIPYELFSDPLINTYNVYMPDNKKNKEAWDKHLKFDACTLDMVNFPQNLICCGECGSLQKHWKKNFDKGMSKIDNKALDKLFAA